MHHLARLAKRRVCKLRFEAQPDAAPWQSLQVVQPLLCLMRSSIKAGLVLVPALLSFGGPARAQPAAYDSSESKTESRERAGHERRVLILENQARQESSSGADELARERRRADFYKAAYWFVVANPEYAELKQNERLLEEIFVLSEADRKARRIRTTEDIFEIAAQRIKTRDREAANKQEWHTQVERFFDEFPVYRTDRELLEAFDSTVRTLGSDPGNEHRGARWFLDEAHTFVRSRFPDRF